MGSDSRTGGMDPEPGCGWRAKWMGSEPLFSMEALNKRIRVHSAYTVVLCALLMFMSSIPWLSLLESAWASLVAGVFGPAPDPWVPLLLGGLALVAAPLLLSVGVSVVAIALWAIIGAPIMLLRDSVTRLKAMKEAPKEPDASRRRQDVQWWGLLRAGWQPSWNQATLYDQEHDLVGRPWCVLRKDSMLAPVYIGSDDATYAPHARIDRECWLLHSQVPGASVPFAVILRGETYRGRALPWSPADGAATREKRALAKRQERRWSPDAAEDDDRVDVTALGEHAYCERAGFLAFLESRDEAQPQYSWRSLWRRGDPLHTLRALLRRMWRRTLLMALLVTTTIIAVLVEWNLPGVVHLLVDGAIICAATVATAKLTMSLVVDTKTYLNAVAMFAQEPHLEEVGAQSVHWWGMLQAGWSPRRPQESMYVDQYKLAGKPWRILQKGRYRVPAYMKQGNPVVGNPQRVRIQAYCMLIEESEPHVEVPYGIVLYRDYEGETVPWGPGGRATLDVEIGRLRHTVRHAPKRTPSKPRNPMAACRLCPWGYPRRDGSGNYASSCGTQYSWLPPHERAVDRDMDE